MINLIFPPPWDRALPVRGEPSKIPPCAKDDLSPLDGPLQTQGADLFRTHEEVELIEGESRCVLRGGLYICPEEIRTDLVFLHIEKNETSTSDVTVKAERPVTLNIRGLERFEVSREGITQDNYDEIIPRSAKLSVTRL